jgi:hypothetical protein
VDAADLLRTTTTIVLIDYPGTAVPAAIARAGYTTIAKEGPAPDDYCEHVVEGDEVAIRKVGVRPERADIVYSHRPEDELPGIIDLAQQIGARRLVRDRLAHRPGAGRVRRARLRGRTADRRRGPRERQAGVRSSETFSPNNPGASSGRTGFALPT